MKTFLPETATLTSGWRGAMHHGSSAQSPLLYSLSLVALCTCSGVLLVWDTLLWLELWGGGRRVSVASFLYWFWEEPIRMWRQSGSRRKYLQCADPLRVRPFPSHKGEIWTSWKSSHAHFYTMLQVGEAVVQLYIHCGSTLQPPQERFMFWCSEKKNMHLIHTRIGCLLFLKKKKCSLWQ